MGVCVWNIYCILKKHKIADANMPLFVNFSFDVGIPFERRYMLLKSIGKGETQLFVRMEAYPSIGGAYYPRMPMPGFPK